MKPTEVIDKIKPVIASCHAEKLTGKVVITIDYSQGSACKLCASKEKVLK